LATGTSAPADEDRGHALQHLSTRQVVEVEEAEEGGGVPLLETVPFDALSFMEDLVFEMEQALQRETA